MYALRESGWSKRALNGCLLGDAGVIPPASQQEAIAKR
jgi:hypothetical protein